MKPAALFTLDNQNIRHSTPLQQAQLAEEIIYLFRLENILAEHEQQLQAGTPDPPEGLMDYSEVNALIKILQQERESTIPLQKKEKNFEYFTRRRIVHWVIGAVVSLVILWVIWKAIVFFHTH